MGLGQKRFKPAEAHTRDTAIRAESLSHGGARNRRPRLDHPVRSAPPLLWAPLRTSAAASRHWRSSLRLPPRGTGCPATAGRTSRQAAPAREWNEVHARRSCAPAPCWQLPSEPVRVLPARRLPYETSSDTA